jgi:hypothetical protein
MIKLVTLRPMGLGEESQPNISTKGNIAAGGGLGAATKTTSKSINEGRDDAVLTKYKKGKLSGNFSIAFVSDKARKLADVIGVKITDSRGNPLIAYKMDRLHKAEEMLHKHKLHYSVVIRESVNEASYNKDVGHYTIKGGKTYVDSNFINKSSGILPNSELKHMGFGEFYIDTPNGSVQFARQNNKIDGFVGRTHKIYDDKGGKLVKQLIAGMHKQKRVEQVMPM